MKKLPVALLTLLLTASGACQAPAVRLERLALEQRTEAQTEVRRSQDALAKNDRLHQRADKVRTILDQQGQELTPLDELYAALVLVESDRPEDLEAAQLIALKSAEGGENRGFRVAAEAQDRLLVKRGLAQRYGTQFVWEPVNRIWRLYPVDPRTSDVERKVMGVPPMSELKAQEAKLNADFKADEAKRKPQKQTPKPGQPKPGQQPK